MIGIISALEPELRTLAAALDGRESVRRSALEYHTGTLDGVPCVVCECGVGKVNAALHAQILIDLYRPDAIVFTGVAGALSPEVNFADTVIGDELVYHDMTPEVIESFGPLQSVYRSDERLVSLAADVCDSLGVPHRVGRIATGDRFVCDTAEKTDIFERTAALCTEMEGCAVAHTATLAGVPLVVLRAISDMADGSAHVDFPTFLESAGKTSASVVRKMIPLISL